MKMPQLFWIDCNAVQPQNSKTGADLLMHRWADNEFVFILGWITPLKWGLLFVAWWIEKHICA